MRPSFPSSHPPPPPLGSEPTPERENPAPADFDVLTVAQIEQVRRVWLAEPASSFARTVRELVLGLILSHEQLRAEATAEHENNTQLMVIGNENAARCHELEEQLHTLRQQLRAPTEGTTTPELPPIGATHLPSGRKIGLSELQALIASFNLISVCQCGHAEGAHYKGRPGKARYCMDCDDCESFSKVNLDDVVQAAERYAASSHSRGREEGRALECETSLQYLQWHIQNIWLTLPFPGTALTDEEYDAIQESVEALLTPVGRQQAMARLWAGDTARPCPHETRVGTEKKHVYKCAHCGVLVDVLGVPWPDHRPSPAPSPEG